MSLAVGKIKTTELQNPLSALSVWFGSYYVLNMQYPNDAAGVLEFIQR